jgi:hypothetical protein
MVFLTRWRAVVAKRILFQAEAVPSGYKNHRLRLMVCHQGKKSVISA